MAENIAPVPSFPERTGATYERKMSAAQAGLRGPLRFEEGVATDTDVPNDFQLGLNQGYDTPAGRPNHNLNVMEKYPEETMRARAHVGSASWVRHLHMLESSQLELLATMQRPKLKKYSAQVHAISV